MKHSFNGIPGITDEKQIAKDCINSLAKNFTLISLLNEEAIVCNSQASKKKNLIGNVENLKSQIEEMSGAEMCKDHKNPIYWYVEKPFALCCKNCAKEYIQLKLPVKILPKVRQQIQSLLNNTRQQVDSKRKALEEQLSNLNSLKQHSNQINDQSNSHFEKITTEITQIYQNFQAQLNNFITNQNLKLDKNQSKLTIEHEKIAELEDQLSNCQQLYEKNKQKVLEFIQDIKEIKKKIKKPLPKIPMSYFIDIQIQQNSLDSLDQSLVKSLEIKLQTHPNLSESEIIQEIQEINYAQL